MVECRLCHKLFERIAFRHLKCIHNVTMEEYLRLFPDAELTTPELRRGVSNTLDEVYCDESAIVDKIQSCMPIAELSKGAL